MLNCLIESSDDVVVSCIRGCDDLLALHFSHTILPFNISQVFAFSNEHTHHQGRPNQPHKRLDGTIRDGIAASNVHVR